MNQAEKYRNNIVEKANSGKFVSPVKAIRAFCLECVGFQQTEIKDCRGDEDNNCPLYKFRFGRNTTQKKKKLTKQQKTALQQRLRRRNAPVE